MLERKLEAYINEVSAGRKESFCDIRTSSSQLGTVDSILTARKYDPQKAKEALIQYLQHENEKADKIIVEHLSRYKEDMQELKNKYPEYFK